MSAAGSVSTDLLAIEGAAQDLACADAPAVDGLGDRLESRRASIGQRVKEARRAKGWSQDYLAELMRDSGLDWSRNVITNMESGRTVKIDVVDLQEVARVLGLSLLDLIDVTGDQAGGSLQLATSVQTMRPNLMMLESALLALHTSVVDVSSKFKALEES